MDMHKVLFRNEDVTVYVRHGSTLLEAARKAGIDVYPLLDGLVSCHGKGLCGTCVVSAEPAEGLAPKNKREAWRTSGKGVAALMLPQIPGRADLRLACKAEVTGEVRVETSPDLGLAWKRHPYYSGRSVNSWETEPRLAGGAADPAPKGEEPSTADAGAPAGTPSGGSDDGDKA